MGHIGGGRMAGEEQITCPRSNDGRFLAGPPQRPLSERFWEKVSRSEGCWLWTASITNKGYGRLFALGTGARLAHRVSWELTHGPIPQGKCVLHRCDTPLCVRPDHLFLGSMADNARDMVQKGRQRNVPHPGETNGSARLTLGIVERMREQYHPREVGYGKLGELFGVSKSQTARIVKGQSWKNKRG